MKHRNLLVIVSLLIILSFFQNCGQVGLLPGQSTNGFESNGGGYSGIHETSDSIRPVKGEPTTIDINDDCSGKIQVYIKISNSDCDLTGYSQSDFLDSLSLQSGGVMVRDHIVLLPTTDELICEQFQKNYALIINSCDASLAAISRSEISFKSTAGQVIIENEFYKPFGIFNIKSK